MAEPLANRAVGGIGQATKFHHRLDIQVTELVLHVFEIFPLFDQQAVVCMAKVMETDTVIGRVV